MESCSDEIGELHQRKVDLLTVGNRNAAGGQRGRLVLRMGASKPSIPILVVQDMPASRCLVARPLQRGLRQRLRVRR